MSETSVEGTIMKYNGVTLFSMVRLDPWNGIACKRLRSLFSEKRTYSVSRYARLVKGAFAKGFVPC